MGICQLSFLTSLFFLLLMFHCTSRNCGQNSRRKVSSGGAGMGCQSPPRGCREAEGEARKKIINLPVASSSLQGHTFQMLPLSPMYVLRTLGPLRIQDLIVTLIVMNSSAFWNVWVSSCHSSCHCQGAIDRKIWHPFSLAVGISICSLG